MVDGILIPKNIGIGDAIQFTSLPENYFKTTGKKLVDLSRHWVFDRNPYIIREFYGEIKIHKLWERFLNKDFYSKHEYREIIQYRSNAEVWASMMGVEIHTRRPNLYYVRGVVENLTLVWEHGISQSHLQYITLKHVQDKYSWKIQGDWNLHFYSKAYRFPDMWTMVEAISKCRQIIGPFSGPSWIAACFPHITVKAVFSKSFTHVLEKRIPLNRNEQDSLFDDMGLFKFYNQTDKDVGYTESYLKL